MQFREFYEKVLVLWGGVGIIKRLHSLNFFKYKSYMIILYCREQKG